MGTWVVGLIVLAAVYVAARHVIRVQRSGGCVGCGESSCPKSGGCCHCTEINLKKK